MNYQSISLPVNDTVRSRQSDRYWKFSSLLRAWITNLIASANSGYVLSASCFHQENGKKNKFKAFLNESSLNYCEESFLCFCSKKVSLKFIGRLLPCNYFRRSRSYKIDNCEWRTRTINFSSSRFYQSWADRKQSFGAQNFALP